jgi:hypothetical protein
LRPALGQITAEKRDKREGKNAHMRTAELAPIIPLGLVLLGHQQQGSGRGGKQLRGNLNVSKYTKHSRIQPNKRSNLKQMFEKK